MKNIFTLANIQAFLFVLLSVAETVVMSLFKPYPAYLIAVVQIVSLLAIAVIRFAYHLAYLSNMWHSMWNRKNSGTADDEPSDLAIGLTKASGYLILLAMQVVLIV